MEAWKLNIQLLADAGTLVNATDGYVNAYTGAKESFSGKNDLSVQMKEYYDTELLENARANLVHSQFAKKQGLPKNRGRIIEFRKWNTLEDAGELQEGVIPAAQKLGSTSISKALTQHGTYTAVTDILELHAIDDVILGATTELGASAGTTQDKLVRNVMVAGTNKQLCDKVVNGVHTKVATRAGLDKTARLTPDEINKAVTTLKKLKAPTINGKYIAIIHPSVAYDLRNADGWIEAHKYASPTEIFTGEIGELHGVRFVETTEAKIFAGADLASDSRTLKVKTAISSAGKNIAFEGGTVATDALKGRLILVGDVLCEVASNTASSITVKENVNNIEAGAVIAPGEGGAGGLAVYATMVLGKDAYGMIDPEGGNLQMIIKDKATAGGPLDQFSTLGYKFENASLILYEDRMVRIESCGEYSDVDEEN